MSSAATRESASAIERLIGTTIDGKYQIEGLLGRGGMGAVFKAVHLGTDRTVALKVIVPDYAGQSDFVTRFEREARACGRLRHPNIVDVTDFGYDDTGGRRRSRARFGWPRGGGRRRHAGPAERDPRT